MKTIPFSKNHLDEAGALFIKTFNAPPWDEEWEMVTALKRLTGYFNFPGFTGLVLIDNSMKAFIMGHIETWYDSETCFIDELCVDPDSQRSGLGSLLINEYKDQLTTNNISSIYLLTKRNSSPFNFYKKNGFDTSENMTLMSCSLI